MRKSYLGALALLALPASLDAAFSLPYLRLGTETLAASASAKREYIDYVVAAATTAREVHVQTAPSAPITVILYTMSGEERARVDLGDAQRMLLIPASPNTLLVRIVPRGGRYAAKPGALRTTAPDQTLPIAFLNDTRASLTIKGQPKPTAPSAPAAPPPPRAVTATLPQLAPVAARVSLPAPLAPPAPAAPRSFAELPKALQKLWAPLMPYVGTNWSFGKDVELYEIGWDREFEGMVIRWDGLFGGGETLIAPAPDGKSLRYMRRITSTNARAEALVKPMPGSFFMAAVQDMQMQCRPVKKSVNLNCTTSLLSGKKWTASPAISLQPVSKALHTQILAQLPERFPQRTRSQFHPTLGIFAEMAERSWYPVTKLGQRVNGTEPMLLEIGGSGSAPYVIRNEYTPVILSGTAQSQLKGRRADPTGSNPNRQIPYWITVGHQGYTAICQQSPYNATSSCENWYLSLDAKTALSIDENGGRTFFQSIPPKRNASLRIFEKLAQRYFRSPDGRYKSFDQQDNYAAMRNYTRDGTVTEVCSYVPEKQSGTCGYSTNRNVVFGVEANGFTLEGSRYRLEPGALIITDSAGVEKRWTELSRGNAALAWQDVKVEKEHREAMREYRRIQREEAKRNAESAAAWQALAQNILTGAYANKSYQPAPQSVWAARVAPGGVAQPSGYAQSMGVTHYTPAPQMTYAQRQQSDELERFKMREQMYRGQAPTSFAEDARIKTDAQIRERNALEAQRAREQNLANAQSDLDQQTQQDAIDRADADEARRRADEAAKAERLRKEKLAAEEVARKRREAEAKERAENAPVEWKEGVVLCAPAKAPSRNSACHGPLQTTYGTLGEQSGSTAVAQACGVNQENVRSIGQSGGYMSFGCGYGIHPSQTMRNVPLHGDPPARLGVGYVDGRRSYWCPTKQTNVCR